MYKKYLYIFRSLPDKKLFRVWGLGKLSMTQTYAGMLDAKMSVHENACTFFEEFNRTLKCLCPEVTGVYPTQGSIMGGTLLTIHGRFFDQTDQPARVLVGGNPSLQTLAVSWQLWQQQTIAVFWKTDAVRLHETQHIARVQRCGDKPFHRTKHHMSEESFFWRLRDTIDRAKRLGSIFDTLSSGFQMRFLYLLQFKIITISSHHWAVLKLEWVVM